MLLLQGLAREGLRWAEDALKTAALAGYTGGHARAFQIECIYALAANRRYPDAISLNESLSQGLDGTQRDVGLALDACLRYLADGGQDVNLLRRAFAHAANSGFVNMLARARDAIARLCERALANDIEPDFVRRLIAVQQLDPPEDAGPSWPWPVRIRTLGSFELEIRGERYTPAHKTQDKPLELPPGWMRKTLPNRSSRATHPPSLCRTTRRQSVEPLGISNQDFMASLLCKLGNAPRSERA